MEVGGIEPPSEEVSPKGTTSVVCGQDSCQGESTDKRPMAVASFCMAGSKLSRLTFTAHVDALYPMRGTPERTAA